MKKLNFGCGDRFREGYINIDIRPVASADMQMASWERGPFTEGSVDEIYSRHMLEHLLLKDAIRTVANWFWLLRPGGFLRVIVPDMTFHAQQLLGETHNQTTDPVVNFSHAMAGFYGWHDPKRGGTVEDAHRWGYTQDSMFKLLREAGFRDIARSLADRDTEPWHLNVTAQKEF